ncbi:MAG: Unknown protein [uncultured Sulfurovum sp.]|uniref:Phytanoyl-CoA dioxygenase n=1 Tax=uncultured Sulfurovum sp. TaxID=269237 RepID=A0A6S6SU54_9BACT|nr:MAG: Unknown protein [uncultured Sulfurovum sp.]
MKKVVNTKVFKYKDNKFIDFFNKHGWVVIENFTSIETLESLKSKFNQIKREKAHSQNIPIDDYASEITQWRNLWREDEVFKNMIFNEKGVHSIAQKGMQWSGVKLLHDHVIEKLNDVTSIFPWHQDSMFWPVDIEGCSVWTPFENVTENGGCLEVIDGSHLNTCDRPLDFMAEEKNDFDISTTKTLLPIKKGSTILLHSLTYHRSSVNKETINRTVYLSLWIHPDAKWRPDLVDWHPINKHVESKEKECLEGKMFPMFGKTVKIKEESKDIHEGTDYGVGISMFNASDKIKEQFRNIVGETNNLFSERNRHIIISETIRNKFCKDEKLLNKVLYGIMISISSYGHDESRNVYNSSYKKWWEIAGEQWDNYQIVKQNS